MDLSILLKDVQLNEKITKNHDAIPDLIIIGYTFCPFSLKALSLVAKNATYHENFLFIDFSPSQFVNTLKSSLLFRDKMNYTGTFPVILLKQNGVYNYIGGAQQLEILFDIADNTWTSEDVHW